MHQNKALRIVVVRTESMHRNEAFQSPMLSR